ncbi:MAG: hypothetical protein MUF64_22540 [Polyangiaceae bacterium]|jgi:hypothetical protein|nr:hypothetical protein [Polyangiaceae bacterium]
MKISSALLWVVAPLAALNMACSSSAAVQAAEKGDYAALKRHLADGLKNNSLDGGEARSIAEAVARHEVQKASGEDSKSRVRELRACAAQASGILEDRAGKDDEAAALAALTLLDERLARPARWRDRARHEAPHWRAVGARTLVDTDQAEQRRALFADLFTPVRQAAFRAAADAADPADQPLLLDAVRLDPDEEARITAARGVGATGGAASVLALKDRWFASSEPVRLSILRAWGTSSSYEVGGREQLFWAAEGEQGAPALIASVLLLRGKGHDADVGRGGFLRALREGVAAHRVQALLLANLGDAPQKELVLKAAESDEGPVKVAALGRLTELKDQRDRALTELGAIAAGDSNERNAARSALAKARDRRVVQLLADDTSPEKTTEPGVRAWAAGELASMKEFPHAAQPLADEDPSVRTRVACAILAVPR